MAVSTNNLKNGMCIMYDGKMWIVVEFQHVKPGKGGAFVRTKLKELKTGRVVDITFRAGEKLEDVRVETKRM
jgi:elongation factor P